MGNRAAHGVAVPAHRIRSRRLRATKSRARAAHKVPAAEAPPAVDVDVSPPSQSVTPSLSSLHQRGGLGKSLLLAFLLLAIVPLSILAFITYHQVQRDVEQGVLASLETVVSLQEAHLVDWVEANQRDLALVAGAIDRADEPPAVDSVQAELEAQLVALQPAYRALVLVDVATGQVLGATDSENPAWPTSSDRTIDPQPLLGPGLMVTTLTTANGDPPGFPAESEPAVRYLWDGKLLLGLLSWDALGEVIASPGLAVEGLHVHLVTADGSVFSGSERRPALLPAHEIPGPPGEAVGRADSINRADEEALLLVQSRAGAYEDERGVPVFGAYRWVPELGLGILAEQPQEGVLSGGDAATALIVGATLAVALLTAAIAAVVTRQITRPIVQLTATASWMARGDLSRRVAVTRRDEIGVLAGAFNRMAAELQILYANLEARVAERTGQLAEANEQARYHARQLAISAEVARVASSIRDLPTLLSTVVELIGRSFELDQVSIYLLRPKALPAAVGGAPDSADRQGAAGAFPAVPPPALWQAGSQGRLMLQGSPAPCVPALVEEALAAGTGAAGTGAAGARGESDAAPLRGPGASGPEDQLLAPGSSFAGGPEMAVPLQVCGRTLGVLHVTASSAPSFAESDPLIYRSLADQIAIAIENASAYALERETVRRLRELDRIQSRFLTNMSHALRTPLNSIIGFSRVMLKGLDGPLNELQHSDLVTIHEGGRQLLGLIDDLLELSQWDIAPFDTDHVLLTGESQEDALSVSQEPGLSVGQVDLVEIVEGVMDTARALARGKPIRLYHEVPGDLPSITTNGRLVRRLILALLADAVKLTSEGQIRLVVTASPGTVTISVGVTGKQEPAFAGSSGSGALMAEDILACQEASEQGQRGSTAEPWTGQAQVAVAQHIVERLGGQILPGGSRSNGVEARGKRSQEGTAFAFTLPTGRREATGLCDHSGGQT